MNLPHRLSIAGLMGIVFICSLGLVALRSGSAAWAGGVYLLTYAVLLLAIVGAICRPAAERPGWLGFALFGVAYFRSDEAIGFQQIQLPTTILLDQLKPGGVKPIDAFGSSGFYWVTGHCLWSLVAATLGGGLALVLFAGPPASSRRPAATGPATAPARRSRWRAAAIGLILLVPISALLLIRPGSHPALWASTLYLATWVLLGTAALGCACGRGRGRLTWFGAALFGLGYMNLSNSGQYEGYGTINLVTTQFLNAVRPMLPTIVRGFPAETAAIARANARVREALDREIPMRFARPTALGEVLAYVRAQTKDPDGRELPIYVDPQGLQDADRTLQSTVEIDLVGVPLEMTLRLALRQANLTSSVTNGLIFITSTSSDDSPSPIDDYLLVGHCFLAMLAAGLGALVVPLVAHREV